LAWSPLSSATNSCAAKKNTSPAAFFRPTQFAGAVFPARKPCWRFFGKAQSVGVFGEKTFAARFSGKTNLPARLSEAVPPEIGKLFRAFLTVDHLARLPFQVSCSLTAEAGRISRGPSAPQRSTPALFSQLGFFIVFFLSFF
jgi:hypothetical protein